MGATIHPSRAEIVENGIDDNCNNLHGCFPDEDNDGFRPLGAAGTMVIDDSPNVGCGDLNEGASSEPTTDCNDNNPNMNPGRPELPDNNVDDNCSGRHGCFVDMDSDGHRELSGIVRDDSLNASCNDPTEGTALEPPDDCNDNDPMSYPGAMELCDDIDQDCNGAPRNGCPGDSIVGMVLPGPTFGSEFGERPFFEQCPPEMALVGYEVRWTVAGCSRGGINTLVAICRPTEIRELPSSPEYMYQLTPMGGDIFLPPHHAGGSFDQAQMFRCSGDEFVVGISGFYDPGCSDVIEAVRIQCGRVEYRRVGASWQAQTFFTSMSPNFGDPFGTPFTAMCPPGQVATGSNGEEEMCCEDRLTRVGQPCSTLSYTPQP
jgi:hypothetical protein